MKALKLIQALLLALLGVHQNGCYATLHKYHNEIIYFKFRANVKQNIYTISHFVNIFWFFTNILTLINRFSNIYLFFLTESSL